MNAQRRKEISKIVEDLQAIQLQLESLYQEEYEAHGNLPENLQYSERGEAMENAARIIEDASSDVDSVVMALEEILYK